MTPTTAVMVRTTSLVQARLARNAAKARQNELKMQLAIELIRNPVVELIAGIAAISYLNKGSGSWLESVTGIDLAAGGEYAGLVAIIGLQQIAPLIPTIAAAGVDALGAVAKAAPMLAL